jgi:hypothetical protein
MDGGTMTRNSYPMAGLAAAGMIWAARRWGVASRAMSALNSRPGNRYGSSDRSSLRGETIYHNTPSASEQDLSHLGATGV